MDATNAFQNNAIERTEESSAPSYDEPYRFGRRPTSRAPFPFTEREFARLLILRSRIQSQAVSSIPAEG
jgi:hypothetical protein